MSNAGRLNAIHDWIAANARRRKLWSGIVFAFGRVRIPFLRPLLTPDDVIRIATAVIPGDVLAVKTRRWLSSYVIPGEYSHTALYVGGFNAKIIHAVAPVVTEDYLFRFLLHYDDVAILRPPYPSLNALFAACSEARQCEGMGYDAFFSPNNGLWYCHEFCAHCLGAGGVMVSKAHAHQYLASDFWPVCRQIEWRGNHHEVGP